MEMRPHFHDGYVLWFNGIGAERYTLPGERGILQPDSFSIVEPGEVHGNSGAEGCRTLLSFYIDEQALSRAGESIFDGSVPTGFRTAVYRDPQVKRMLTAAHSHLCHEPCPMSVRSVFLELVATLFRRYGSERRTGATVADPSKLHKARSYMRERLSGQVRLADVAAHCGCTEYHLIRLFRHHCGLTPHAYLMKARTELARALLADGCAIAETAYSCGFTDQSHLSRHFRNRFGLPPGRYRKQVNSVQETDVVSG